MGGFELSIRGTPQLHQLLVWDQNPSIPTVELLPESQHDGSQGSEYSGFMPLLTDATMLVACSFHRCRAGVLDLLQFNNQLVGNSRNSNAQYLRGQELVEFLVERELPFRGR